jgi:lysophospholipase L1-like esterase
MSPKKTKNKSNYLFFLLLFIFSCTTLSKKKPNYFSVDFKCSNSPGWNGDINGYQSYKFLWTNLKNLYSLENSKLNKTRVVITGDSLIQLFTMDKLKKEFPGIDIQNRGIGGDTTYLLLDRINENVINLKPDIILLEIGGNDLIQGKCLSFIENNFTSLIQTIQTSLPSVKIIIISVPPTGVAELNSIVPVYNLFLFNFTNTHKNIEYVDVWKEMRDPDKPIIKKDYSRLNDKIHFNDAGYEAWGKLLRPYIK